MDPETEEAVLDQLGKVEKGRQEHGCGCVTLRKGDNFVIHPCSADCMTFALLMQLSAQDGKSIEFQQE